jgi:hypothetical protein
VIDPGFSSVADMASRDSEFVLRCCIPNEATCARPDASAASLDFVTIRRVAQRHGVAPLVARRLERMTDAARGSHGGKEILASARANWLRNDYLVARLIEVVRDLEHVGIEVIVIKGPALAELAYGNLALRSFGDLDILVRPDDVPRAAQVLTEAGFDAGPYDDEAFRSHFFQAVEANFQRRNERLNIDLHWELSPPSFPFGPAGDGVWHRAITIQLGGTQFRTLSHEDHLLYLAVHHARHGWDSLSQLCDIAFFVNRVRIDWDALTARAAATCSTRMLAVALLMAHDQLNAIIPATALAMLRCEVRAGAIAAALGAEITHDRASRGGARRRLVGILNLIERPVDRLHYVMVSGFAPTLMDRRLVRLRRDLYPLYFLLRPMRIGAAAIRTLQRSIGTRAIVGGGLQLYRQCFLHRLEF